MKIELRFGMHRDVQLIHDVKDLIDGLVIPAHILAHQSPSTSVFVTSMHEKPYVIDPMTFVFQNCKDAHLNEAGEIRPSVQKMCDAYHDTLAEQIIALQPDDFLSPEAFSEKADFCEKVVRFQIEQVAQGSADSGASKYLKRYGKTQVKSPRLVIPPYFRFDSRGDEWYQLSLACAKKTRGIVDNVDIAPVVCFPAAALSETDAKKIAADYADFSRVFIWIDNYVETSVTSANIKKVRELLRVFHNAQIEVETLYGGYLLIMSSFDGLSAISHGILYTQQKATSLVPGSGGAPERYYIPAFHGFRSLSQTDLIMHKHPEVMCNCAVCKEHLAGNPDNIILYGDSPDLLRRHFLHSRRREADDIGKTTLATEAKGLRQVFSKYHESVRSLPNPDALISSSKMQGLEYLNQWADAFAEDS